MALLKKKSYLRDNLNATELDWRIYLLKTRPLEPSESQKERNMKIQELTAKVK